VSWQVYLDLRQLADWRGIRSFLIGFAVLALAALVSAVKAGVSAKLGLLLSHISRAGRPNETSRRE
jgi:hypothetical protein